MAVPDPVVAGQLISAENQNALIQVVNDLLGRLRKRGDMIVGTGLGTHRSLEVPDGTGRRAIVANLSTKEVSYQPYQPLIPQQATAPTNPAVGDLWIDTS